MNKLVTTLAVLATAASFPTTVHAQAKFTATEPGSFIALGATGSAFQADYGQRKIGGATLYLDANLYRKVGVELEARTLRLHADAGVRQNTYLIGPRLSAPCAEPYCRTLRPYVKLLAGRGSFSFPYGYASGSYFVVAPGTGIDLAPGHGRFFIRLIDVEYQYWPQFTCGKLNPYGISSGISYRVF